MAAIVTERPRPLTSLEASGFVVGGTWMVIGLFLDGWSHRHQRLETFFTPWHAMLYSGFVAAVVWSAWTRYRMVQTDPDAAARPVAGERVTAIGGALFAVGAVSDFAWHQVFGIESSIKALLSPTHLLLMTGGLLALTGPVRAAWQQRNGRTIGWREFAPVLGCLTLSVAVLAFFTQEISAFTPDSIDLSVHGNAYAIQQSGIAAVLVTNALLMGAVLFVLRRWQPPFGSVAVMFTVVAGLTTGLDSFHRFPLALAAGVGGLAADVLLRQPLTRARAWLVGGVTPAVLWTTWVAVYAAGWGVGWHPDLWLGMIFFTVLSGLALGMLTFPPPGPDSLSL